MRRVLIAAIVSLAALVSACGGSSGGSGSSGGGASSSVPDYSSAAASAKLLTSVGVDPTVSNLTVTLAWTDGFPAGTSYTIKSQNTDGSFATVATVAGTGGTTTWTQTIPYPTTATTTAFQIQATVGSTTYTLQTAEGATTVQANYIPASQWTIGAASDEISTRPGYVKGNTTFNIYGSSTAFSGVNWSVNSASIGAGASTVKNPVSWNSSTTSYDRTVTVAADILAAPSSHVVLTRQFVTHNTPLLFGIDTTVNGHGAVIYAQSPLAGIVYVNGIPSMFDTKMGVVSVAIDGTTLASLPGPNICYHHNNCNLGLIGLSYQFTYNANLTQGAQHTAVFTGTDQSGNTGEYRTTFIEPYTISTVIDSPLANAVVSGSLHYSGTTTDLEPGGPTTTIWFGPGTGAPADKVIATVSGSTFSGDIDLTGYPPGSYHLYAVGYMQDHTASKYDVVVTVH